MENSVNANLGPQDLVEHQVLALDEHTVAQLGQEFPLLDPDPIDVGGTEARKTSRTPATLASAMVTPGAVKRAPV